MAFPSVLHRAMSIYFVPEAQCPVCGAKHNAAAGNGRPQTGDLTICIGCGTFLAFTKKLALRVLTAKEAIEAMVDPQVSSWLLRISQMNRYLRMVGKAGFN